MNLLKSEKHGSSNMIAATLSKQGFHTFHWVGRRKGNKLAICCSDLAFFEKTGNSVVEMDAKFKSKEQYKSSLPLYEPFCEHLAAEFPIYKKTIVIRAKIFE